MITKEQLEKVLKEMPGVEEVTVIPGRRLIAMVISPAFEGQNEALRQEAVWNYVHEHLGAADENQIYKSIEFIFTDTPEEQRAQREQATAQP